MTRAFTLVELLVIVCILALLSAIAIPGFLEAQTRSKVAEAQLNMTAVAHALESYAVDHDGKYPNDGQDSFHYMGINVPWGGSYGAAMLNHMLTTPVAYLTPAQMADPFPAPGLPSYMRHLRYVNFDGTYRDSSLAGRQAAYPRYYARYGSWMVMSIGPDRSANPNDPAVLLFWSVVPYDPTNGALSRGDVVRCQAAPDDGAPLAY